jgi:hypothetical protein
MVNHKTIYSLDVKMKGWRIQVSLCLDLEGEEISLIEGLSSERKTFLVKEGKVYECTTEGEKYLNRISE